MCQSVFPDFPYTFAMNVHSVYYHSPLRIRLHSAENLRKLALAVALHTGNAHNLPLTYGKRHIINQPPASLICHDKIFNIHQHFTVLRIFLLHFEDYIPPNHQPGNFCFGQILHIIGPLAVSMAQHRNTAAKTHYFFQLV